MPGPGPHLMYAMGTGLALTTLSNGRFSPHHTLFYTINAFFGPDIGSFSEWLDSILGFGFGSKLADLIHHPFYYVLFPGLPLCLLYSWVSRVLLQRRLLDSFSRVSKLSVSSPLSCCWHNVWKWKEFLILYLWGFLFLEFCLDTHEIIRAA